MTEPTRRIATIAAPYGREIRLIEVTFENGSRFLRLTIREGTRFTILDLDAATAQLWAQALTDWASIQEGSHEESGRQLPQMALADSDPATPGKPRKSGRRTRTRHPS
ncbi:MAG: hypothetical protein FWD68_04745 [Alphaproteobacteria bacterium]|nr:hypothetical protein [Alphaproteobacteria bacterium]